MSDPSCTITVSYDGTTFSFTLNSGDGWSVADDGTIHPPEEAFPRTINFQTDASTPFVGFRVGETQDEIKNTTSNYYNNTDGCISVDPEVGSSSAPSATSFAVIEEKAETEFEFFYYTLAVEHDGSTVWDDPKIYDPPDQ